MTGSPRPVARSILIVEDEPVVARDLEHCLVDLGYEVVARATSSEEALRCAAGHPPDLALMDIHIRGPRDGVETAELLRVRHHVPVIFLTAHADASTIERVRRTEPFGYLVKPFQLRELRSAVEIALYRSQADRRRREQHEALGVALRLSNDAVISTGADGRIQFVNPAAETLIGVRSADAVGRALSEVLRLTGDDDGLERALDAADSRGIAARSIEGAVRRSDGSERFVRCHTSPIRDDAGATHGAVVILQDVSERRGLESALERADRLAAIGTLTAGVAHEVRNPLTYVIGNLARAREVVAAHLAESAGAGPTGETAWLADVDESLTDAHDGVERIRAILLDLQGFSRPQSAELETVELRTCLETALGLAAHDLRVVARVVPTWSDAPPVRADAMRLVQVFVNLFVNAAHAMAGRPAGTNELAITTGSDERGRAVVEIRDTGCGIPPEVKERIFEPFFTTKPTGVGTGLGLSVSHGIVRSFGGEIAVESAVGRGTTFRIALPAAADAATATRAGAELESASG